jgi:hypothetical protein
MTVACGGLDGGVSMTVACGGLDGGVSMTVACGGLDGGVSMTMACGGLDGGVSITAKAGLAIAQPASKATRLIFIVIYSTWIVDGRYKTDRLVTAAHNNKGDNPHRIPSSDSTMYA